MGGLQASVKLQSSIQKWKLLEAWVGREASEVMGGLQSSVINLEMELKKFWVGCKLHSSIQIWKLLKSWGSWSCYSSGQYRVNEEYIR